MIISRFEQEKKAYSFDKSSFVLKYDDNNDEWSCV